MLTEGEKICRIFQTEALLQPEQGRTMKAGGSCLVRFMVML